MAKKKQVGRRTDADKARVELRLDADVYEKLKNLAAEADISINQLMQGATRWLVEHGHAGEPHEIDRHEILTANHPGCVWFGGEHMETVETDDGEHVVGPYPYIAFALDFTERRVVRDDWPRTTGKRKEAEDED